MDENAVRTLGRHVALLLRRVAALEGTPDDAKTMSQFEDLAGALVALGVSEEDVEDIRRSFRPDSQRGF